MTGGIILAAGVSSRMGKFKPMLPIGGTTFIKRLISQMRAAGVEDIVVVTGYRHDELEKHLKDMKVKTVFNDRFYATQMLDSVKMGIDELKDSCDKVMLSPVDVVMSPQWLYEKVIKSKADFVRPLYNGEPGHPVLIKKTLFDYILNYEGDRGLRGAVESSGKKILNLDVEDPNILLDADTFEDYRKALSEYDRVIGKERKLHPEVVMKVAADEIVCGDGFVQLMDLINETGSIRNAAAAMHMSYTKAWKMLKYVESIVSYPMISREIGGDDGGGSTLTMEGKDFLKRYKAMQKELESSTEKIFEKYFGDFRI